MLANNFDRGTLIKTNYYGPTNTRGSRVKATIDRFGEKISDYRDWSHQYDVEDNHILAVGKLLDKLAKDHWPAKVILIACETSDAAYNVVVRSTSGVHRDSEQKFLDELSK